MLTGVAAGVMSLIYGQGSLKERFGVYLAEETQCIACGKSTCLFEVKA
jgi:predicted hydrocarbon binding protein